VEVVSEGVVMIAGPNRAMPKLICSTLVTNAALRRPASVDQRHRFDATCGQWI
jgi:hypothetical protein